MTAGAGWAESGKRLSGVLDRLAPGESYQLAQSCGSGMSVCSAGSYGPGGCYKPGYATCTAGLVCTGGMTACAPSNGAQPYCYKPGYGKCN
ncbi:hypothetical protein [Shimia sp.]|uniref:hypothetical protein n=1 Tax=Shimia sp. TaxID=1954381 RepID=UPI0035666AA6